MRVRWVAVAMIGAMVAGTAGCGEEQVQAGPAILRAEGATRVEAPADAPVPDVVAGMLQFGHSLAPVTDENWVASPTSIAFALAMARAGADGATAQEIDATLGFPAAGLHEAFNALSRRVVTATVPPPPDDRPREPGSPLRPTTVCIGNALFPSTAFEVQPSYLRTLAEHYGTGVYPVDFGDPSATDLIDAWASQQTAGRIQKVFDQIDPDAALILANTVYLRGDWQFPFTESATSDEDFRAPRATVRVPMMRQQAPLAYAEGDSWKAVELPYGQDSAFAMRVLLPTGSGTPRDLLAAGVMTAVDDGLAQQRVDVAMPRFDFAGTVPLREELIRLGVVSAFDDSRADFSRLGTEPTFISQAIHRATITVDEYGTEAAAVTALEMMPLSAPPEATATLHADRPFAFAIVHVATGAPLFIGQVNDPTAS